MNRVLLKEAKSDTIETCEQARVTKTEIDRLRESLEKTFTDLT